jgi:hypothetical protein
METRSAKRVIIVLIYLALLSFIVAAFYNLMKPKETCTDKVKNQNEEDIDCGGICAPCEKINATDLTVQGNGLVENGRSDSKDFWALVTNPNNAYGAKSFEYNIKVKDSSGAVVGERNGTGFVLPGERKYIIENNVPASDASGIAEFTILNTEWIGFNNYYEKPNLKIVQKSFNPISSGVGFAEVTGLLKNDSPYDFSVLKIEVILKDSKGIIIALNSTEMRTVKAGEERGFRAFWPNRFAGDVQNVDTQVDVNIFDSEAIIKTVTSPKNPSR